MAIDDSYFFEDADFARRLKTHRQTRELTLDQLSALTKGVDPAGNGVSRVALSRYENGASLPGLRELRLISFSLRRPLSSLIYGERIDPMSAYKLELEMRIRDAVLDSVMAEGLIKETFDQAPEEDEKYQKLLDEVRKAS